MNFLSAIELNLFKELVKVEIKLMFMFEYETEDEVVKKNYIEQR